MASSKLAPTSRQLRWRRHGVGGQINIIMTSKNQRRNGCACGVAVGGGEKAAAASNNEEKIGRRHGGGGAKMTAQRAKRAGKRSGGGRRNLKNSGGMNRS
jgi:hypothetical protein